MDSFTDLLEQYLRLLETVQVERGPAFQELEMVKLLLNTMVCPEWVALNVPGKANSEQPTGTNIAPPKHCHWWIDGICAKCGANHDTPCRLIRSTGS